MNPSSTPMSDDFEIREPTAKHPSPSEGLKRFVTPMSDELDKMFKSFLEDYPQFSWEMSQIKGALQAYIAHHTKEAVEAKWRGKLIPYEKIRGVEYVRLDWLMNELAATEQKRGGDE